MRHSTLQNLEVDDGRSVLSNSSLGSHSSETIKHSTNTLQAQLKNRKFTAALGRVGHAREARDAVAKLINRRSPPIAQPLDFEGFVTEFNAELETDSLRDLVVFPRDDITLCKPCKKEIYAAEKVAEQYKDATDWGLVKEAIQHFSTPCSVIKFNYESFFGDCEKYLANSGLEELIFESEDPIEILKEKEKAPIGKIKEGHLLLEIKGESNSKLFKGRKRRFCLLKRTVENNVIFEVSKQKDGSKSVYEIKSAHLKTFNKQRTNVLQLIPTGKDCPHEILAFEADSGSIGDWFQSVDLAIKSVPAEESDKISEPSLSETINESLRSSGSSGDHVSRASLRQKNSVESLLRPPTVKRKNVFSLYENVEPMSRPPGEGTAILEDPDDEYQPCSVDLSLMNVEGKNTLDGNANQTCHSVRRLRQFVDLTCNSMRLTVTTDAGPMQIEPFFVNVFLFDPESGERLTNELEFMVANEEYKKLASEGKNNMYNMFDMENLNWEASLRSQKLPESTQIVVRVERILSGVQSDVYFKNTVDKKSLAKHQKVLLNAFNKLNECRTLIGWTTRPLKGHQNGELLPIYRHEGHLNDQDLKKFLGDHQKLLKAGKLTPIPNAQLGLNVDVRSENVDVPLKTLDPLRASDFYSTDRLQFDAFADTDGHRQCKNQLYVYPTGLCYGSQKSFSRARNILCTVRFLRQSRLRPQFVDLAKGTLVTEKHCTVQYHDANPSFFNEIRVELPVDLEEDDHLIFEFSHISLTAAQKSGDETVNQKAGIAWLQLVKPDKSLVLSNDVDEFELPVATNLPTDYFKLDQHSTPSRKSSDGSIKWVEGGKPLFKVKLRLHSTLFSSNPLLNRFFQQCLSPNQPTLNVKPDVLLQIPFERLEPHLFVTLSSLLQLFTRASDLSSAAILTTLVGILENSTKCQKKSELREFIKFHLAVGGEFEVDCRALYEGLLEAVGILLSSAQTEQSIIISTLSHLWFIIDVTVKSMTQTILTNGSHKYSRRRRFSQLTLEAIDATFLAVSQQILQNHQKFAAETRSANLALAYLAKHSLNIADRGAIYASLYEIIKRYDTNEVGLPRHFKLDLMQILVGHEHWLPLNLPMLFDSNNKPLLGLAGTKIDDHAQDAIRVAKTALKTTNILSRLFFQFLPSPLTQSTQNKKTELNPEHFKLGKTFCSTHFLVGLLLQEFVAALHESRAYRRLVIAMLRNLLVKHSLDLRYDGASQSRIAVLYAPFVQILIEHVDEFEIFGKLEDSERAEERKESVKFDYAQSTARSILSKDISTLNGASGRAATNNFNGKVSQFTEKLDLNEARDLILCVLYILNNLPKQVTVSLAFNQQTSEAFDKKEDDFLAMINLLKVSLTLFRSHQKSGFPTIKHPSLPSKEQKSLSAKQLKKLFIQDSHLSQEVALIVLDVAHNLAEFVAGRWNGSQLDAEQERKAFLGIIDLILDLVGDQWPEGVRLNALNTLGMFIELFSNQLSSDRSNEALPKLCQRLLLLLNSRLEKVQCAAAAILHLLIRQGFNVTFEEYAKQVDSQPNSVRLPNEGKASADWLGNAGLQITIALAYLLGQNELSADSPRFEHGIHLFESLTANQLDQKLELFKRSAQDLATQLRDIVKATMSITEARNDPVRLAELHVKLADSYRGSPALRAAWFDTLAQIHRAEHWFSEAAVCQAHCVAIIAKQLKAREKIDIDLSLLSCLNHQILEDERVNELELPLWHSGNFTIDAFTSKVEETVKVLIDAERYEAVGPIYRMAIPLHENAFNNKALTSVYAELHQAYSRAAEIQTSRKRHLGSYFRVILHSTIHFGDEHQSAWIYKEPALTSLAEESERMVRLFRKILRTEKVRFLTDAEVSIDLDPSIAHIQLTHVDPLLGDQDDQIDFAKHLKQTDSADVNYSAHTNISNFYFEKPLIEPINEESNEKVPEQARLALKRVFLKTKETFPNTRRRLPIIKISEEILSPLELACENLIKKASQIQQVLSSAGIGATGPVDRSKLQALDMKGLQCLLQGSVSPTVNVGVLAYAEAFTSDSQRSKYGVEGMERLKQSFKVFMAQLARALMVNELAVAEDQAEYQIMLKNSFDGMLERLCTFFDGENFLPDNVNPFVTKPKNESNDPIPPKSSYILDSISGIPHRL